MEYDTDEFWEAYEERAAILEFDAYMDREDAEKMAFELLAGQKNDD